MPTFTWLLSVCVPSVSQLQLQEEGKWTNDGLLTLLCKYDTLDLYLLWLCWLVLALHVSCKRGRDVLSIEGKLEGIEGDTLPGA